MIYYIAIVLWVGIIQLNKSIVINNLSVGEYMPVIQDYFYITNIKNTEVVFGVLHNMTGSIIISNMIAVVIFLYLLIRTKHCKAAFTLILAGIISNFIDRIFIGGSTAFLAVRVFNSIVAFNTADMLIISGIIIIGTYLITHCDGKQSVYIFNKRVK
jgi:Lipoprotein signal peptidase